VQVLQRGPLKVRMDFDLVHGWHDGGLGTQVLEVFDLPNVQPSSISSAQRVRVSRS